MQKTITYEYRAPFAPSLFRCVIALWRVVPAAVVIAVVISNLDDGGGGLAGPLLLVAASLVWPVMTMRTMLRDRARAKRLGQPTDPPTDPSPAAVAAGDPAQTVVHFRNGTFVPAGQRDPEAAAAYAVERLSAPRDLRRFQIADDGQGGDLVAFADVTVHLSPDEVKHGGPRDLGRHAAAKLSRDARNPEPVHVRGRDLAPSPS